MRLQVLLASAIFCAACSTSALADVLTRATETNTLRIGFRTDTPPFSSETANGEIEGYTIGICQAVGEALAAELGKNLNAQYVAVTAENRFDALVNEEIDLLCGATTATIERRKIVDFSIPIFIDGTGLIVSDVQFDDLGKLASKRLGVRAGTTTEQAVDVSYPDSQVARIGDHAEGLAAVREGEIDAYFADRTVLAFLLRQEPAGSPVKLANNLLTIEPYALALPHGDSDFRLIVDRTISRLFRSGDISAIAKQAFEDVPLGNMVEQLYKIAPLPE